MRGLQLAWIAVAVALTLVATASTAGATTLRAPLNGTTIKAGSETLFDWTWNSEELESRINFSQNPDPALANWANAVTKRTAMQVLSSDVTVKLDDLLTPGTWYWRTCSITYSTPDDVCFLGDQIWSFTLLPEMTLSEARAATRTKVKSLFHPITTVIGGCEWFDVNKFDCSGHFRTRARRCHFASSVDNTGDSVQVRVYGKTCKKIKH
jgi:hypothetical protein